MRILYRYILGEMLKAFALALAAVTAVVCLGMVLKALQEHGLGPISSALYMVLSIPFAMHLATALAAVLAASLVYGRLTHDREVLACRASGIPVSHLLWPAVVLATGGAVLVLLLGAWPLPASAYAAKRLALADIENIFFNELADAGRVRDRDRGYTLTVDQVEGDVVYGPTVKMPGEGGPAYVYAPIGKVQFDRAANEARLTLWGSTYVHVDETGRTRVRAGAHLFAFDVPTDVPRKIGDLAMWELRAAQTRPELFSEVIRRLDPDERTPEVLRLYGNKTRAEATAELHARLATAVGCGALVMLGAALGMLFHSGHLLSAFGVAFVPWLLTTVLTRTGVDVVGSATEDPGSALWLVWTPYGALAALAWALAAYVAWGWTSPRRPFGRRRGA